MAAKKRPRHESEDNSLSKRLKANKRSLRSLPDPKPIGALYWDINMMCHFRSIVHNIQPQGDKTQYREPSTDEIELYNKMCWATQQFIDKAVQDCMNKTTDPSRIVLFIEEFGWKLFSICAHAESFRQICLVAKDREWWSLKNDILDNKRSVEVYARSRQLEWRGPLLKHAQFDISGLREALMPQIDIGSEHPHHLVQMADGHLRRPHYKGIQQVNIGNNMLSEKFPRNEPNPLLRQEEWGECDLCGSVKRCNCRINSMSGDLLELVDYKDKGVGVRVLTDIKKGEILGEYVGIIQPPKQCDDEVYALTQEVHLPGEYTPVARAYISSAWFGSWTRFINHSCNASTQFMYTLVGEQANTIVRATRDIAMFEELTIDYGRGYWEARRGGCCCGSTKCRYPPSKQMGLARV